MTSSNLTTLISIGAEIGVILMIIIFTGNIQYNNGKIEQCQDMGKIMTNKMECVECYHAKMILREGKCIRQNRTDRVFDFNNQQLEGFEAFRQNGTIL